MTGGLLDFFTLEASEYVEQLDALVSRATTTAPDAEAFQKGVRALRGAATMAKVTGVADVAAAMERVGKRVREGAVAWDTATRSAVIATIDDLKILIRGARNWGAAEDTRAGARITELSQIAPRTNEWRERGGGSAFLASAAADAAAALLEVADAPAGREQLAKAMEKVRALRGVAALNDLPPLGEVVDAVDAAAKPIEMGQEATAERRRLFRTAARVLLEGGDAVRNRTVPPVDSPAVREFALASASLSAASDGDDVVPIAALLADGADAVKPAANPPTTAAQRFRLEVVSQAEHLRRLVHDGRSAADTATRERVSRELRSAVRALARAAQSFAAVEIANLFLAAERTAAALDAPTLDVLDRAAMLLSASDAAPESAKAQFVALSEALAGGATRAATPVSGPAAASAPPRRLTPALPEPAPAAPARSATPAVTTSPARAATPTLGSGQAPPSGAALRDLLSAGLAGLAPLGETHLAEPVIGEEDDVIPIEDLLFRGKDALDRAIQIGDALKQSGGVPDAASLAELYDLLQLAAAE